MRRRFGFAALLGIVLVLSLGISIIISAQTTAITPGETVEGTLDATTPFIDYDLTVDTASTVTITLESSDFDAYLALRDSEGTVIVEDDDSAGRLNSQIVTELAPGDYIITATSLRAWNSEFELFAAGDFSLAVTADVIGVDEEADPDRDEPVEVGVIMPGETVEGELTPDVFEVRYALTLEEDSVVTITLESADFDAYVLVLMSSDGTVIAEDDDSAGQLNAQIDTTLSAGEYIIVATSLQAYRTGGDVTAEGTFSLSVIAEPFTEAEPEEDEGTTDDETPEDTDPAVSEEDDEQPGDVAAVPFVAVNVGSVSMGEAVTGELSADVPIALYDFALAEATDVSITLESTEFDAYLVVLMSSDGTILAEDDDSAGRLNAQIDASLEAGDYLIAAASLRAYRSDGELFEAGGYTLTVAEAGGVVPPDDGEGDGDTEPPAEGDALTPGSLFEGELVEGEPFVLLPLEVSATSDLTITLTSEDFDPYLVLLEADGETLIAQDDDSAGDLNSQIEIVLEAGSYVIQVTSFTGIVSNFEDGSVGTFTLTVEGGETDGPGDPQTQTTIAAGETVTGNLSMENPTDEYVLEAEAGTVLTITLISFDFDTYLQVLDASGEVIAFDDDSAGSLDSRIGVFIVPDEGGPFTVVANSYGNLFFDDPGVGAYDLSVVETEVQPIAYGETAEGSVTGDAPIQGFRFTGEAGDIVSLTLNTDDFSLFMELTGNGLRNFSSGGVIGPVVLPEDGDYIVTVASFDPVPNATFTVSLETVVPQEIAFGEEAIGVFDAETSAIYYTFEGSEGDVLDITLDSGESIDTFISLLDPEGFEIAFNDDGGAGFDPELRGVALRADGAYSLVVRPYIEGDSGAFTLTVDNQSSRSLEDGPIIVRISDKQFASTLSFDGVAGETVTLVARPLTVNFAEPRVTVRQDGEVLATNTVGRVGSLGITFEVPGDGPVIVTVEDLNGNASVVEFTLVRVE